MDSSNEKEIGGVSVRLIERAFDLAKQDLKLNWKEIAGNKSNPLILECYKSVDDLDCPELERNDDEIPWCSCYMNKKIQEAGGRGTRSAMARSWLRWGRKSIGNPGDIAVFERGNDGYSGHVTFVVKIEGNIVSCLGGNQADSVCIREYDISKLIAFRTSID